MNGSLMACEPAAMIALSNLIDLAVAAVVCGDFEVVGVEKSSDAP